MEDSRKASRFQICALGRQLPLTEGAEAHIWAEESTDWFGTH